MVGILDWGRACAGRCRSLPPGLPTIESPNERAPRRRAPCLPVDRAAGYGFAMRLLSMSSLVSIALGLLACSDDGVPASGTDDESGVSGSSGAGSITDTSNSNTNSASASQTGTASDSAASTGGEGTTAVTTADSSGGSIGSTGLDSGDTGAPGSSCIEDADCVVVDNCCDCRAISTQDEAPPCNVGCAETACTLAGVEPAVQCEFGTCQLQEVNCNQLQVFCDAPPPACDDGFLPGVDDKGCWTNACVPVDACDVVPSCEVCPEGQVCIELVAKGPGGFICSPVDPQCDGMPSCACMDGVCPDPFSGCFDGPEGMRCECLAC
jgi:hypothetical protein